MTGTPDSGRDGAPSGAVAALMTPLPKAKPVAAMCALYGVKGTVLETSAGALVLLEDSSPETLHTAASVISKVTKAMPLLAMERRDGQITIWKYADGTQGETMPPGLALNDAPGVLTSLLTGTQTMEQIAATHEDKVASANMGRFAAFWQLRKLARAAKRAARDS